MSIERCNKHDYRYDTDKIENCPLCGADEVNNAERYVLLRDLYPVPILLLMGVEAGRDPEGELDTAIDKKRFGPQPAFLFTTRHYPCGCNAQGCGDIPAYCAEHSTP